MIVLHYSLPLSPMSQHISNKEWARQRESFEGRKEEVRIIQQRLFRVFQALARQDMNTAEKYVADGVALDLPLLLDEASPDSVPNASQWRPVEGGELTSITLLGWAAANGEKDVLLWLLRRGAEPSHTFSGNRDAAWLAMERGHDEIHKILMDRGAMPGLRIKDEATTSRLMAAARGGHLAAVRHVLSRNINVNAYDTRGRTALHYNLARDPYEDDDVEIGRLLLQSGANPNMEDADGIPPHALNESPMVVSLLQGHELAKSNHALAQKRQAEVAPEDPVPDDILVPPMPRQGPKGPSRL